MDPDICFSSNMQHGGFKRNWNLLYLYTKTGSRFVDYRKADRAVSLTVAWDSWLAMAFRTVWRKIAPSAVVWVVLYNNEGNKISIYYLHVVLSANRTITTVVRKCSHIKRHCKLHYADNLETIFNTTTKFVNFDTEIVSYCWVGGFCYNATFLV